MHLVCAPGLSVEKLARYFIRSFKDVQQGKTAANIKTTLGQDLQALTDQQVFRWSTQESIDSFINGYDPP